MSLKPELEKILTEELSVEERDQMESMSVAYDRITVLIESESKRRKIGLHESNSDKS